MSSKKQTIILIICTILPAIGTVVTGVGSIINDEPIIWKWLFLDLAILSCFASVISMILTNRLNLSTEKELNKQKELISQYENYIGDGKKMLVNETFISVDEKNYSYKISIRKKFEILDKSKNYYMIRLHCDKFLDDKEKSKKYYEENKVDWDKINLKARLKITNKNNQTTEYCDINMVVAEKVNNYYFVKVEYKKKLNSGQVADIPFETGDIFELNYSFTIGTEFWGNYIERDVSFFREKTYLYFDKNIPNFDKNQINISIVNMHGKIQEVPTYKYEWQESETQFYKLVLPLDAINLTEIDYAVFRIMWDANIIFDRDDLNTKNASNLGLGAALRHST